VGLWLSFARKPLWIAFGDQSDHKKLISIIDSLFKRLKATRKRGAARALTRLNWHARHVEERRLFKAVKDRTCDRKAAARLGRPLLPQTSTPQLGQSFGTGTACTKTRPKPTASHKALTLHPVPSHNRQRISRCHIGKAFQSGRRIKELPRPSALHP
jgi:hypothetical protein